MGTPMIELAAVFIHLWWLLVIHHTMLIDGYPIGGEVI